MPSPFLGIDPYLESQEFWPDFHHVFITALRRAMNAQLPKPYVARIDERMNRVERDRETFIEIHRRPTHKVVAVVEVLSPNNKTGDTRRDYLAKRNALMNRDVHLIELDLLLAGPRLPMERPLPPGHYFALVARAERRPDCDVFAWTVRDPLPTIPVPLLAPDPDIVVDLAPLFASVYEEARYAESIDYSAPLTLPLAPEDRAWAEEVARTAER